MCKGVLLQPEAAGVRGENCVVSERIGADLLQNYELRVAGANGRIDCKLF